MKKLTTLNTLIEQIKYQTKNIKSDYNRELFIMFVSAFASDLFIRSIKDKGDISNEKLD